MNVILENRLKELDEKYDEAECWYLVKQSVPFDKICYLVSFLEEFQNLGLNEQCGEFIEKRIRETNAEKGLEISENHRTLMIAAYYGLIKKSAAKVDTYKNALITETYYEVKKRCNGNFEDIDKYKDIIKRQIEKMFISTNMDAESGEVNINDNKRKDFKLYLIMFLYKILLEVGHATGEYSITFNEFEYLVETSKTYESFLDTLLYIKLYRENDENNSIFAKTLKKKFDNRIKQLLGQLDTIVIDEKNKKYFLDSNKLSEVREKVYIFEQNYKNLDFDNYLNFLGSTRSLTFIKKDEKKIMGNKESPVNFDPIQKIFYGVPGAGKSFEINKFLTDKKIDTANVKRVVFHPEYTNADFIGQIMPKLKGNTVEYSFEPGPLAQIIRSSYQHPDKQYVLIIEEINRGNSSAIFGDSFQLLDRLGEFDTDIVNEVTYKKGWSSYGIDNDYINAYIRGAFDEADTIDTTAPCIMFDTNTGIRLPANLSLLATMNTSDQNVFKLDNAFKRRWDLQLISNDFDYSDDNLKQQFNAEIQEFNLTWDKFRKTVNKLIIDLDDDTSSFSDRQLGKWFVKNNNGIISKEIFLNKVIEYLWDDVFTDNIEELFNSNLKTLAQVIETANKDSKNIFSDKFYSTYTMIDKEIDSKDSNQE